MDETVREVLKSVPEISADLELRKQVGELEMAMARYLDLQEGEDDDAVVDATEEIVDLILTIAELVDPGRR